MNKFRKTILGVPVDALQPQDFIRKIEQDFPNSQTRIIFAVNPEKIMLARRNQELFTALTEADFLIPDGIGIIIALKLIYGERISRIFRVTGIELTHWLLNLAAIRKYRIFIFGASPQVNSRAAIEIQNLYPSLELAGTSHGYIPEQEHKFLIERINSSGADILFVGLGSPKQEVWINRYKKIIEVEICMGIGGSLDVIAGKIQRAPFWMRNLGLEWLYRLIREPSRIKRQMDLPKFAFEVIKERISSPHWR